MKIVIKATEEVSRLARTAIEIQDAINPFAVGKFLQDVQTHFRGSILTPNSNGQEKTGPEMGIQNPVSVLVLDKLLSLARMDQGSVIKAGLACEDLKNGKDVEWEISLY